MFDNGDALATWGYYTGNRYRMHWSKYTKSNKTWSTGAMHSAANQSGYSYAKMAYNATANKVVHAWQQSDGSKNRIFINTFNNTSGAWGTEVILSDAGQSVRYYEVDIDNAGNIIVAWSRYNGSIYVTQARYFNASSNAWSASKTFTSSATANEYNVNVGINNSTGDATVLYSVAGDVGWFYSQYDLSENSWTTNPVSLGGVVTTSQNQGDVLYNETSLILHYPISAQENVVKIYTYATNSWSDAITVSEEAQQNYVQLSGSKNGVDYVIFADGNESGYYSSISIPSKMIFYLGNTTTIPTISASTFKVLAEDAVATIATSELNYSSSKSLKNIKVTTLPSFGNLFVDSNLNICLIGCEIIEPAKRYTASPLWKASAYQQIIDEVISSRMHQSASNFVRFVKN